MTSALLIFLVIVIVVTSTLLYLYFNKLGPWKKGASPAPAPAPASGPTLPSITDFSVDRTLSPPKTDTYTIEPYTIEGYTVEDLNKLSQNVTFNLEWKNGIGFTEAKVDKIEVYHGVMPPGGTFANDSSVWKLRETITAEGYLINFAEVKSSISGLDNTDGNDNVPYSFEGRNFFKIVAYYPDPTGTNTKLEDEVLHNDYDYYYIDTNEVDTNYGIVISSDELVGTTELLTAETVTYEPRLDTSDSTDQPIGSEIANQYYDFYYYVNESDANPKSLFSNVRLVPTVDSDGINFKLESGGKYFNVETRNFDINEFSEGSVVKIAESLEEKKDLKGHDKVIMLESGNKYLFGFDGFKTMNDDWVDDDDKYFRRNIYIKKK